MFATSLAKNLPLQTVLQNCTWSWGLHRLCWSCKSPVGSWWDPACRNVLCSRESGQKCGGVRGHAGYSEEPLRERE